jgi:hypothetical protein
MGGTVLGVLAILDAAFAAAVSIGINVERYQAMRAENGGGPLTPAQLDELELEAREKLARH